MTNAMEKVASRGLGTVKQTKARVKRLTGIFEELAKEHGEVAALMLRTRQSSDPSAREALFPEIRRALLAHERAELEVLYGRLRGKDEAQWIVRNHDRDATGLEMFIRQLTETDPQSSQWSLIFHNLTEVVLEHAREEEDHFFPEAQQILGREEAGELLEAYRQAKQRILRKIA